MKKTPAETQTKATVIWQGMTENERHGVRFGMFPHEKTLAAEKEGFNGHQLCIALMDCAQADGGMRA